MFTGIVEEIGKVIALNSNTITIAARTVLEGTNVGDSIAVNGVCLTVREYSATKFLADVSPETLNVTTLGTLRNSDFVNLERALPANGRFGGHIVTGHIDGKGKIKSIEKNNNFYDVKIELTKELAKYVVKKGSLAVNGISLTVANIENNVVEIAIIPHTFENTNLKALQSGDLVNIETDILAKYIEKFLLTSDNRTGISMQFLLENGFE